ncbi:TonB-dependent siderophore receptor [Pseudomonas aeruginosa]|nr:TonB-dependent siderophore receptor [Pseudomonas aeruginosa]
MRVSVSLVLGVGLGCSSPALWAETESPAELEVLTVTAEAERAEGPVQGYRANRSASATRTDTRIEDIPQAISVVPRQVLDDLDSARIERALDFAGGVSRQNNFGGLTMFEYNVRGFTTSEFYRDGFSANRGYMNAPDSATIERVEILKGPASSLYGRGDPGGTVNLVTKKPQAERFARLHASAGSWDRYRSTLDLNTPLDEEGDLLYRMNLAVEDSKGFRDYADGQRLLVAPSFSWQLDPDTSLLVEAEVVRNRQVFDRGTVAPHNHLGSLPRSRFFGEPDDGKIDNNNETLQATLRHHLNEQWSLRLASHYKHGHLDGYASENSSLAADGYTLRREYRYRDFEWHDSITQLDLLGDLHTGSIRHQLLMGLEYERYHNDELILRSIPSRNPYAIDIRRPVYGQPKPPFGRDDRNHEEVDAMALNLQDQIEFSEKWRGLLGVRFDRYRQDMNATRLNNGRFRDTSSQQTQRAATPRIGVLYQATPEVGLFANASKSFKPNGGTDMAGKAFDPEEGRGYEAGVKLDLLDGRLGMTLAAFHLKKKNVLTADPSNPGYQQTAGEARSQGFDLQFSGQLTEQLRLIGAYAYIDAEVTKDENIARGSRLLNVPKHSGSLMGVYEFREGWLHGADAGAAVNYVGERAGDSSDSGFELPAYTTVDLLAHYPLASNRLLTVYARECCGCYEILRRKLDRLSGLIGEDCSRAQWQADSDDPALQALGLRLRDAAVQALCELEKHLCQGVLHEPGEMGRYLGSLLESIRGELDSAGIDADARVLFVGSGALPTSALVLAREVGAHLCCLDIDEEALSYAREIARCQGLEARMQFSSLPPAELAFSRDATHFLIASLVQQKSAVLAQIRQVMRADAKVLLRHGSGIKGLFNYPVEPAELEGWQVCAERVSQPLYDTLILEKAGR